MSLWEAYPVAIFPVGLGALSLVWRYDNSLVYTSKVISGKPARFQAN